MHTERISKFFQSRAFDIWSAEFFVEKFLWRRVEKRYWCTLSFQNFLIAKLFSVTEEIIEIVTYLTS